MRVLFVYDHCFMIKEGKVYSNKFSYDILKRYVDTFSNITVLARSVEVDEVVGVPSSMGEGVEFIFVESISTFKSFFGLRQRMYKHLEETIDAYDAVIVRFPSELGLMAATIAQKKQKKYLIEVVGCSWDAMWNYGGWKSKIYAPLFFSRIKNAISKADNVSYVTEYFLQKRYPALLGANSMAVSDVKLSDPDEGIFLQRIEKIENLEEKIVFGTIGDWSVGYKGIDTAIKVLSQIMQHHKDFEYHLLGPGDPTAYSVLADNLGIGDKVFFDGALPGGEPVYKWLDEIDIYLQPSLAEGLPRSIIEAMSRGCPVIGSDVGGIPELLDESMLFELNDLHDFSEKILTLIQSKALMINTVKRNFHKAKQYQQAILDEKRKTFYLDFKSSF